MTAVAPVRVPLGAPGQRRARRAGRHLRPVERPRRSPAVPALVAVGIVIVALLALAVMHALLIGGQVRLDAMHRDVAAETESIRRLELRVAELESPDRVLDAARHRLGMVQPAEVGYLLPVGVDGGPDGPVRVLAAELDATPDGLAADTRSAEQAEVDRALSGTDAAGDDSAGDTADGTAEVAAAAEQPSEGGRDE